MLQSIFKTVLITGFSGSLLSVILFTLKPVTRRIFGHRWQYFMWYAVLVCMLIPLSISLPKADTASQYLNVSFEFIETENIPVGQTVTSDADYSYSASNPHTFLSAFSIIWIIVGSFMFLSSMIQYWLFLNTIRKNSCFCEKYNNITVKTTPLLSAPLTVGFFKKIILIPVGIKEEEKQYILMHEYIHLRHRDIFFKWLCLIVKCVHWFNPIVYPLSNAVDEECEIMCDTSVTRSMTDDQKKEYMNTILNLISRSCRSCVLTTHMADSKQSIKNRFFAIVHSGKNRKKTLVCVSVLVAVAMFGGILFFSGIMGGKEYDEGSPSIMLDFSAYGKENNLTDKMLQVRHPDLEAATTESEKYSKEGTAQQAENLPVAKEESSTDLHLSTAEHTDSKNQDTLAQKDSNNESAKEEFFEYSDSGYPYSGRVKYDGLTMEALRYDIEQSGAVKSSSDGTNLNTGYIADTLTYKNGSINEIKNLTCDKNGQIDFFMTSDYERHVNVAILENGLQIAGYGIIPDNETTYTFGGLDPAKTYDITISSDTGSTWMVESDYIIY